MKAKAGDKQLAVRVEKELLDGIDAKRIELSKCADGIPSRSDVVRKAIQAYLKEVTKCV